MDLNQFLDSTNSVLICSLDGKTVKESHNADKVFKSASVIKTFVLAYYLQNEKDFDRELTLSKKELIGTSIMTELKLCTATVKELLVYMMGFSDNSATNALFADAGFDALNAFIKEVIGAKNTVVARKMLDFKAAAEGRDNFTTLNDLRLCFEFVLGFELGREILSRHKCLERIARYVYKPDLPYYGKSGDLSDVYNDVAVFVPEEGAVFVGVLTNGMDKSAAKRLCGRAGLKALGAERPVI